MFLVPELNALPGRHAYDQTEFLNTDEILDRVDSIDEAAVLSTCDRYCVFVATKKNLTEALRDVETVVSREIAVRAGRTGRQLLLPHAEGGPQAIAAPAPVPQQAVAGALDDTATQRMLADAFEQVRRGAPRRATFLRQVANHADHFQGDVDALAPRWSRSPRPLEDVKFARSRRRRGRRADTTLTAQQEARLEERAQKRAAREEAKLLKKAEIFKELGLPKRGEVRALRAAPRRRSGIHDCGRSDHPAAAARIAGRDAEERRDAQEASSCR